MLQVGSGACTENMGGGLHGKVPSIAKHRVIIAMVMIKRTITVISPKSFNVFNQAKCLTASDVLMRRQQQQPNQQMETTRRRRSSGNGRHQV